MIARVKCHARLLILIIRDTCSLYMFKTTRNLSLSHVSCQLSRYLCARLSLSLSSQTCARVCICIYAALTLSLFTVSFTRGSRARACLYIRAGDGYVACFNPLIYTYILHWCTARGLESLARALLPWRRGLYARRYTYTHTWARAVNSSARFAFKGLVVVSRPLGTHGIL